MKPTDADRRIALALLDIPPGQRHSAFLNLADLYPKTPAERLVTWQRKQRREQFISWMRTLSTAAMAGVYQRLQDGADPDVIRAEFPPDPKPALDSAGNPNDGNNESTAHRER